MRLNMTSNNNNLYQSNTRRLRLWLFFKLLILINSYLIETNISWFNQLGFLSMYITESPRKNIFGIYLVFVIGFPCLPFFGI
jgi:hypothetical protein